MKIDTSVFDDDFIDSFWSKVAIGKTTHECWPWLGAKKPKGYGNLRHMGKDYIAHRIAFVLANGEIPDGMLVCHVCDNPSCCNPRHLMLGNFKSNYADMLIKGRAPDHAGRANRPMGLKNCNAKLTWSQICEVRSLYRAGGHTQKQLGHKYGISQSGIGHIVNNKVRKFQ